MEAPPITLTVKTFLPCFNDGVKNSIFGAVAASPFDWLWSEFGALGPGGGTGINCPLDSLKFANIANSIHITMEITKREVVNRIIQLDIANPTQIHFDHISSNYAFLVGKGLIMPFFEFESFVLTYDQIFYS